MDMSTIKLYSSFNRFSLFFPHRLGYKDLENTVFTVEAKESAVPKKRGFETVYIYKREINVMWCIDSVWNIEIWYSAEVQVLFMMKQFLYNSWTQRRLTRRGKADHSGFHIYLEGDLRVIEWNQTWRPVKPVSSIYIPGRITAVNHLTKNWSKKMAHMEAFCMDVSSRLLRGRFRRRLPSSTRYYWLTIAHTKWARVV